MGQPSADAFCEDFFRDEFIPEYTGESKLTNCNEATITSKEAISNN